MSRPTIEQGNISVSRAGRRLVVANGVLPSAFGSEALTKSGNFATRSDRRRLLVPEWLAEKPEPIALYLVSDFGDDRSTVECEQTIHAVYSNKGLIYEAPHRIQDVERFNIKDGAYNVYQLVSRARKLEQPGVFVGVVDPGVGSERKGIVISTEEGYTFVGPDNGLFWPAIYHNGLHIAEAYMFDPDKFKDSSVTFHGRDQFSPIGAEIATGEEPWELEGLVKINPKMLVKYEFQDGQVVEKDGYPNIKLWPEGLPLNEREERPSYVRINNPKGFDPKWDEEGIVHTDDGDSIIVPVVPTFESVEVGRPLCYVGSSGKEGLPELAIRNGKDKNGIGNRMNVKIGDILGIEWIYRLPKKVMHQGIPAAV
ncbi:MAG TPA: SAM-dependent chlorinase/fluorinase [Patescibacteria group bacterium]